MNLLDRLSDAANALDDCGDIASLDLDLTEAQCDAISRAHDIVDQLLYELKVASEDVTRADLEG